MNKRVILKRKVEKSDVVSMVVIALLLALFVYIGAVYMSTYGDMSNGMEAMAENLKATVLSYGGAGVLLVLLMHTLQVVVSAIPAALVQFVGGAIYGVFWGVVTAQIGVLIGSLISFNITRIFGRRIVSLFASPATINKVSAIVARNTSSMVLLAMFIMPGFPKDLLAYAVGLTNFKARRFFLISAVGRLPSMIVSTYLGAHIMDNNRTALIIITSVTCVTFLLLYVFRHKIFALINKIGIVEKK